MKKVMILSAAALTLCLALPQITEATQTQNAVVSLQEKEVKYVEITNDKIPEIVTKALSNDYPGYKVDKAFLGSDSTYKVSISKGDMKYNLFYSEKGELIKVEQPAPKEKE